MGSTNDEQMKDQVESTPQEETNADVQEMEDMPSESKEEGNEETIKSSEGLDKGAKSSSEDKTSSAGGKLFIGGLSRDTTTEKLSNHFKKYGELTDSVIMKDRDTGHPRGFGFVTYADPSICDVVLKESHVIDGRTVDVKRSVPRENIAAIKGPKTKKIFVGGIPPSVTEDEFKDHFSKYGTVVEHQIMLYHSTGKSRGFGFITFDSEQAVEDLIAQGTMHDFAGKQVELKKAEPKKATQESDVGAFGRVKDTYAGVGRASAYGNGSYRAGGVRGGGYGGGYGGSLAGAGLGSAGGYRGGSFGVGAYGRSALDGGYDSLLGYGGLGSGYGSYLDSDPYAGLSYGGYGASYGAGYDSLGGGYGLGGYGSSYGASRYGSGTGSNARYHPYRR